MLITLKAAFAYFGIVFAVGFLLGTLRALVVQPRLGDLRAVLLELPLMLAVSWLSCRWVVGRFAVPPRPPHRLALGAIALSLLLAAEAAVAIVAFGRSLAEHVATYRTASAALGLLAQIGFALFPIVQLHWSRTGARLNGLTWRQSR